ncbi:maleylpyruvate isomerase family mycothiol-dependent enzyme [Saccharothrix syringae]|uniref:maleylpyruvate isomerase family mycothiol-dependent enzyme n=1 Tax=Saccharothrix syringae TaxID=103733 RepID=UPI000526C229|nr:maleylpyruvate isomerase family mycothiol-dependent enzyme [Saccharothrix syringae]
MEPPLTGVVAAHRRLVEVIADLDDAGVLEPSLLPGWTRGHVLAHLADAARARARVVEHALRGEVVALWEPGERDAVIEATASRSADEHRAATAEHGGRLEEVWAGVGDWDAPVLGGGVDLVPAVFTRWREVWIHLVDLDLGVRPAEWGAEFAAHVVDVLLPRLPEGVAVRAVDVPRTWGSGTEVVGGVRDLAAWLAGREPDTPLAGPLPELGPWPAYPTRR